MRRQRALKDFNHLIGTRYERLEIIKLYRVKDKNNIQVIFCDCICDCSKNKIKKGIVLQSLRSGSTKSCGCLRDEKSIINGKKNKKYNVYDMSGEFGVCHANEDFIFDKEDFDKIKNHFQAIHRGYVTSPIFINKVQKTLWFHRLVMGLSNSSKKKIDHKNRNRKDNRKQNLRIATSTENNRNITKRKDNTTGIIGVVKRHNDNQVVYLAQIQVNKKSRHLGVGHSFDEAVKIRLSAEKKYFGEFAPQRHLFEKYGVT